MSLNKAQLVDAVAKATSLKKTEIEVCLRSILDTISGTLAEGGDVTLIGFGTFKTSHREARQGINPQTKAAIKIEAKTVAKFKPGKTLSDLVNGGAKPKAKPAAKAPAKKTAKKK